jgi:alkyl hydroperoxide reductase subunit AhpC
VCLPVALGPRHLTWIALLVEIAMTFGPTESKRFGVIPNKYHPVSWIAWAATEIALFDTHYDEKYKSKGVYLLAINSMDTLSYAEDSYTLMQKKAKKDKLTFPYLQDKLQVVAKQFKATHTPQAFVIWKDKKGQFNIKYKGAIDDNAGDATNAKPFLANAVEELLNNKSVSETNTESFGCRIFFRGEKQSMY